MDFAKKPYRTVKYFLAIINSLVLLLLVYVIKDREEAGKLAAPGGGTGSEATSPEAVNTQDSFTEKDTYAAGGLTNDITASENQTNSNKNTNVNANANKNRNVNANTNNNRNTPDRRTRAS